VFHELDANHSPNTAGVAFIDFRDSHDAVLTLNVAGDRLQGIRGSTVLEGALLIGAYLRVSVSPTTSPTSATGLVSSPPPPAAATQPIYHLTIVDFAYTGFWTGSATPGVPVYFFNYSPEGDPNKVTRLCQPTTEDGFGALDGQALMFRGDRYDAVHKTVTETGALDSWFNVACAGTAVAKMHLLRHTLAGRDPATPGTTVAQRQAVLKMLTADYCGTGMAFTETGHPLLYSYYQPSWTRIQPIPFQPWSALDPTTPPPPVAATLDAIWNQDGAVCLDTARLESMSPDLRVDIDFECEDKRQRMLKPCRPWAGLTAPWSWAPLGYAISANKL
jgi:hypothetical protein